MKRPIKSACTLRRSLVSQNKQDLKVGNELNLDTHLLELNYQENVGFNQIS